MTFLSLLLHTPGLSLCIDRDIPWVMSDVLSGLLIAQVEWSVSRLMCKHELELGALEE